MNLPSETADQKTLTDFATTLDPMFRMRLSAALMYPMLQAAQDDDQAIDEGDAVEHIEEFAKAMGEQGITDSTFDAFASEVYGAI